MFGQDGGSESRMSKTQHMELTCPQCLQKTSRSWPADGDALRRAPELVKQLDCGHAIAGARVKAWVE